MEDRIVYLCQCSSDYTWEPSELDGRTRDDKCAGCGEPVDAINVDELQRKVEMLRDHLGLVLPLAAGYVLDHDVGANRRYVQNARAALQEPAREDGE
ncbi:MAG: hypothetical protein GF393_04010 [Armatimonadia bacterium]|nr:hypothetical protein [Armatimonadia bacterium]